MEDLKTEIANLAEFLDDSYFGMSPKDEQYALLIELVVMKMKSLAE